jgi:hypothetical protein
MAILVPIGDVRQAQHLGVRGGLISTSDPEEDVAVSMEVYTGWVGPGFQPGGSLTQDLARTFLPLDNHEHVKSYEPDSLVDFTVTASPASVAPSEDEATVFAVDGAFVSLQGPQNFSGIFSHPFCLELSVRLGGLNVAFHMFTYQVTVLIKENTETDVLELDPSEAPAA